MYAAENRDTTCVELLLEAGAHPNAVDKYPHFSRTSGPTGCGYTALVRAVYKGRLKCVDALLKAGAKVEIEEVTNGSAPFFAVWKRHHQCVDICRATARRPPFPVNCVSWFPSELRGKAVPLTESPYSSRVSE